MDYQESFINYLTFEKRSSSHTVVAYKKDLDQFVTYCTELIGVFNVNKVDNKLVRNWIIHLMEMKYTPKAVNRKISTLKAFYKFLMKNGFTDNNPVINVTLPKIRKKLPNYVEEKSLNNLLDNGFFTDNFRGIRDKLIISLLYGTGIRLAELVQLKDRDFDVSQYLIKVKGKRQKERIIPFPKSIISIIQQYLEIRNREIGESPDAFLVTEKGKPVYFKLVYRVVTGYLGMVTSLEKKSPHVLRHTYATHLLNKGANLNAVKELLGHANLAATQIYTHTTFEKLHSIYKQAHPRGD